MNLIQLNSGRYLDLSHPNPDDILIEDIAHGLSNICRFTGQCRKFYSVAQHSVLVANKVMKEHPNLAMAALLHDAQEAYIGDISSPLKEMIGGYGSIENRLARRIEDKFCPLSAEDHAKALRVVKIHDLRALATERRDLMHPGGTWDCLEGVEPYADPIVPWGPHKAKLAFLETHYSIKKAYDAARSDDDGPVVTESSVVDRT